MKSMVDFICASSFQDMIFLKNCKWTIDTALWECRDARVTWDTATCPFLKRYKDVKTVILEDGNIRLEPWIKN
jgi:hypothetical protein